jgi:hypothetical protein
MAKSWLPKVKVAGKAPIGKDGTIDSSHKSILLTDDSLQRRSSLPRHESNRLKDHQPHPRSSRQLSRPRGLPRNAYPRVQPNLPEITTVGSLTSDLFSTGTHSGQPSQLQSTTILFSIASRLKACTSMDRRFARCSRLVLRITSGLMSGSTRGRRRVLAVYGTLLC